MNKTRLIFGIICLVIASALTVLNLTLPSDKLKFMVGDVNMPWIPPLVLAVVGIILTATAFRRQEATTQYQEDVITDPDKQDLDKRLEGIGWGCFLIMLGGFAMIPNDIIPKGAWSIGVGVILLGLNVARYFLKIQMSGFTTFLGLISLIFGITDLLGYTSLHGALLLIVLGANLILKPWFEKKQLFKKS